MRVMNFEIGDDPIQSVRDDIASERRRLDISERADVEHRVVNKELWLEKMRVSRQRINELEDLLAELLALEESAAELAEEMREPDAA